MTRSTGRATNPKKHLNGPVVSMIAMPIAPNEVAISTGCGLCPNVRLGYVFLIDLVEGDANLR
jgi:hypothetical protein